MFKKILRSFKSALKGLIYCIKNERNMRIHTSAAFFVLIFSVFFKLSLVKYLILILTISSVISLEMMNSSFELWLDVTNNKYDNNVRIIKDVAAGSVLVAATASVVIGISFFCSDFSAYFKIWNFFKNNILILFFSIVALIMDFFYIAWGPTEIKNLFKKMISTKN